MQLGLDSAMLDSEHGGLTSVVAQRENGPPDEILPEATLEWTGGSANTCQISHRAQDLGLQERDGKGAMRRMALDKQARCIHSCSCNVTGFVRGGRDSEDGHQA